MTYWDGSRWVKEAPPPPRRGHNVARHLGGAALEGGLITLLVFGLIAGSAFAAKGGNGNGTHGANGGHKSSVSIAVPDGTFASTVSATVSSPDLWVHAACTQYGTMVYEQWVQTDASGVATLTLGPTPMWSGGAASCTAEAGAWSSNGRWTAAAETSFAVTG